MKRILSITMLTLTLLALPMQSYALTPTPTPTESVSVTPTTRPATGALLNQINSLKDKIASKVAELKLVEKRGIMGTVTETTATQITLNDLQDQTRFIDVDEITKFSSPDVKTGFGISDLTKGTTISTLGLYNKESRRLLARFVTVVTLPEYIFGTITQIDRTNYTITIENTEKKTFIIDIESTTKTNAYSVDNTDPVRTGFSKIAQGEKAMVIGKSISKDKNRISADRILLFPDFAGSAGVVTTDTTPTVTPKTSPTGTRKLTPTATITKKPTPTP